MDVGKMVYFQHNGTIRLCRYYRSWNGIPVYLANDDTDTMSALYQDGTSFIILSCDLLKMWHEAFITNRLWHEVSHLYYGDVLKPWDIRFEFRADIVASAATGRDVSLKRLTMVKKIAMNPAKAAVVDKRIEYLRTTPYTYSKPSVLKMINSLHPVTVL